MLLHLRDDRAMSIQNEIGVIFDMDGVLVDSADAHLRSFQQLARENGREVTEDQFAKTFGRQNRDIIPILIGETDEAALIRLADRKEAIYRDLVRDDMPVVGGAVSLIESLHRRGVKLAVGSSGPRPNIELILQSLGVREKMDAIVSGDDVTRGKPHPDVFIQACDRLGLPCERCIVIEDAPAGIQAAKAAGTYAVAIMIHHAEGSFPDADLVVQRLGDLSVEGLLSLISD